MLVNDIIGNEIKLGDEVILYSNGSNFRVKLIKETATSVGYYLYRLLDGIVYYDGPMWWIRKNGYPFKNMYKIC